MTDRIKTIGILGGGQLGRMLILAAARLGYRAHVFSPPGDIPAQHVADAATLADYDDAAALKEFADACDVITYEFENVPAQTAELLQQHTTLCPNYDTLRITQDRFLEKTFLSDNNIAVSDFVKISTLEELQEGIAQLGCPSILKTRRLGYDGKGQVRLDPQMDPHDAWAMIGRQPAILEAFVPFDMELSVLVARGRDGAVEIFDIPRNEHQNHILKTSTVPAGISAEMEHEARAIASKIATAFDYAGVLAVEMFLQESGSGPALLVNEIAPRVHNSGHWTEAACCVSQFEQHIRAITGMALAPANRHSNAVMTNLLGEEIETIRNQPPAPQVMVHDYGKAHARPGRKMGHMTQLSPLDDGER